MTRENISAIVRVRCFSGWLYRFPFDVLRLVVNCGRRTKSTMGRNYFGQLADMVRLAARSNILPQEYYEYGLARFKGSAELGTFISHEIYYCAACLCIAGREKRRQDNWSYTSKAAFELHCRNLGLPSVCAVVLVERNRLADISGASFEGQFPSDNVFIKPDDGMQGNNVMRFEHVGQDLYRDKTGVKLSTAGIIKRVKSLSKESGKSHLVQREMRNSQIILQLAGSALATARVITLENERGEAEIVYVCFRTAGDSDSVIDNYHANGVAFPIDLKTGELSAGRRLNFCEYPQFYSDHPITGARMEGTRLPDWDAAKKLAIQLHESVPDILLAGWDIAFTENGPSAVEVNIPPGLPVVQMNNGFLATRYSELLAYHVQHCPGA